VPRSPSPQTLRLFQALLDAPSDWQYGYDLSRRTGLPSGTLYPILVRLADRGLLDSHWQPAEQPGRPPRHAYRLTAEGARAARTELAAASSRQSAPRLSTLPETS
jgi:PadR family transcriptional regulator PadR